MVEFKIPIIEVGQTTWYNVSTGDFYTFQLKLSSYQGTNFKPKEVMIFTKEGNKWKHDAQSKEIGDMITESIEGWMMGNVTIIKT